MADYKPTVEQQQVIDIRDRNVLVSAAAGSGKTAVLTKRIVGRITDPDGPSIDSMLIVTFTEAAAAEMRERIGKAVREALKSDLAKDERIREKLTKEQTLVHSALIMTIHGFCLYLIRNHFDRIGVDPSFRVASEEEAGLMFEECMDAAIADLCRKQPEDYEALLEHFAPGLYEDGFREILKSLKNSAEANPFVEDWFEKLHAFLEKFSEDPAASEVYKEGWEYENLLLSDCEASLKEALSLCDLPDGPAKYKPMLEDDLAFVQAVLAEETPAGREARYHARMPMRLASEKASELKNRAQGIRGEVKDRIDAIVKEFYSVPFEIAVADDAKSGRLLIKLLALTEDIINRYQAEKAKKNLIDFSDMEHFALKILLEKENGEWVPSAIAKDYQNHFSEVMVDEYQDSNDVQETLLSAVSKHDGLFGNRFMVGDVKQSIYRFRLAKPEIFQKKCCEYKSIAEKETSSDIRINLSKNFRSRSEVIDSVNCLFRDAMFENVGGIDYDRDAELVRGVDYPDFEGGIDKTELLILNDDVWKDTEVTEKTRREAMVVGSRILQMKRDGFTVACKDENDKWTGRDLKFSDIVILTRKATKRAPIIKATLEEMGIPTVVASSEGYFMAPEVIHILNWITIINNPLQDIPLLGVLHHPTVGFEENELAKLRIGNKKELLYESLLRYEKVGEEKELKSKITAFLTRLNDYRAESERTNVYDLLVKLIEREGLRIYYRCLPMGEVRIANLRILLQKAEEFTEGGYAGLFDFVRYIENVKNHEIDFGEANVQDENADVVRIYTMHKSKGLEFPVCFIVGTGEALKGKRDNAEVAVGTGYTIATDFADTVERIKRKSYARAVILAKEAREKRGEDLRLLYVAMTRAKEKLILVGTCSKTLAQSMGSFGSARPFRTSEIMDASCFMKLLLPEAERNPLYYDIKEWTFADVEKTNGTEGINRELLKADLLNTPVGKPFENFVYPHTNLANVFTKTTVSDLKKAAYLEEQEGNDDLFKDKDGYVEGGRREEYIPLFMREEEKVMSGSVYGTAHHRVMELLDFPAFDYDNPDSMEEVLTSMREGFVKSLFIPGEEDALVRNESVLTFLKDPIARRMTEAQKKGVLYREQPFVLSLQASDVWKEAPESEKVLVQGVIDVYFEEDGGYVLLDYKTDSKVDEAELIKRYKAQLDYYGKALERLEGKPVKEVLIYSFYLKKTIRL
jgi:ATP-dependent helicase/nuclease subunit A